MSLAHWDEVDPQVIDQGHFRETVYDLGTAAGSFRAGVKRGDLKPGGVSTPVHCHADEEELFYVLAGSGLSWQDGRTWRVAAGDCLLHRVHEEAHTMIAGEDGMSVLAFGPRSESNLTWLPRAGVMRAGPRWLPAEVEHPYAAELAAGPLEVPEPQDERPPNIRALDGIPSTETQRGLTRMKRRDIGTALGSETTGMRHVRIAPGSRGSPHHCHSAEEELFVVLSGDGEVRLGEERTRVRTGSVVSRPPATEVAHSFYAGEQGLELLAWGTRVAADACYYPDSDKVGLWGLGLVFRVQHVDYWDGED